MNARAATSRPWSVVFRREREAAWRELEKLVDRIERRGLRAVGAGDLARLPVLWRSALSSLSVARASVLDRNLLDWLEALVARACLCVYAPKRSMAAASADWLLAGFPQAVRALRWHLLVSSMALLLGALVAFVLTAHDLDLFWLFVDRDLAQGRDPLAATESLRQTLFAGDPDGHGLARFASFLFAHNSGIGILTFGLGFAAGVPVLLLLFVNGMMLGAFSALFHERGLGLEWWSWVLPHGVTELFAIALCGASGLAIADGLLFPGRFSRLHELAVRGRAMGGVVAGAIAMLLVAGAVEGVFRQIVSAVPVRYLLATGFAAAWLLYFVRAGRRA